MTPKQFYCKKPYSMLLQENTSFYDMLKFNDFMTSTYYDDLELVSYFTKLNSFKEYCNYSFITFNYDLILEAGLQSLSMDFNYAFDNQLSNGIPLLKLHGSMNWFAKNDKKIMTYPWPDKKSIADVFNPNVHPDISENFFIDRGPNEKYIHKFLPIGSEIIKSGKNPLIIPPTLNKFKYQEQLKNIWAKAASVLSEAELIFIVGYSMPETDVFFKYLYSLGIDSPKYLNKLVVINPDSNLQSKYAILSNSQYNFKKFNFITGSFSQYIDSIFKEIENLIG